MPRKWIFLSAALCLLCLAAGCGPAESAEPSAPAPQTDSLPPAVSEPAQTHNAAGSPDNDLLYSRPGGAQTADGFYTIRTCDDWTGLLVFYDYASRQAVPVCAQPNCEHHDETCPAWFGENIPRLLTNGEQLAFCYLNAPARIETANLDGSNRRVLYEFASNETPGDGFCMDEGAVYLLSTSVDSGQEGSQDLVRIDLTDGSCTVLWSEYMSAGTYSFLTGCRDHFLVLKEIRRNAQAQDTAEQLADQTHTLLLADPRDGSTAPLYEWQQGAALESAVDDTLYCITDDHRLCAFSGDGQLTELARDDRFLPSVTVVQYADDAALWFTAPENGTEDETCLYRLDLADGTIAPVPLSRERSLTVLGRCGDALFVRLSADDSLQASLDFQYALVSGEQLTASDSEAALELFTELF